MKRLLILAMFLVVLPNCTETGFNGTEGGSDSQLASNANASSNVDGGDANGNILPFQNACFAVTCVSDAYAANTFEQQTDSDGVIYKLAPSGASTWVLKFNQSGISESHNCWSDQQVAAGGTLQPDQAQVPLCQAYAARTNIAGLTFYGGYSKNFRSCSREACNVSRTQVVKESDYSHHWFRAKKVGSNAHVEIKTAGWNVYIPNHFEATVDIAPGQCQSSDYLIMVSANQSTRTITYRSCYANGVVTIGFDGYSATLDLNGTQP